MQLVYVLLDGEVFSVSMPALSLLCTIIILSVKSVPKDPFRGRLEFQHELELEKCHWCSLGMRWHNFQL